MAPPQSLYHAEAKWYTSRNHVRAQDERTVSDTQQPMVVKEFSEREYIQYNFGVVIMVEVCISYHVPRVDIYAISYRHMFRKILPLSRKCLSFR